MNYLNYESNEDGLLTLVEGHVNPADPYTKVSVNSKEVKGESVVKVFGKHFYLPTTTPYEQMMLQQAEKEFLSMITELAEESKKAVEKL